MHLLNLTDLSHIWDFIIAQTPTPNPTVSPQANPTTTSNDIELLKAQIEFLKTTNAQLNTSFTKFVEAMKFTLFLFTFLGGFLTFIFGKNLNDAKNTAKEVINQEVKSNITNLVTVEIENLKRTLQREKVISSTVVDYYLPINEREPDDCILLRKRGFLKVRFWNKKRQPKKPSGDVFVLD